ncbi:hypothetical protein GQ600_15888 [Phytophthora cactorum]|nr:hypothetical protein GQ600_15888 [Phytophthora cactorum]
MKRRGGKTMREKYSESSPRDYWDAMKKFPLLKKIAAIVYGAIKADEIDLARYQSCPESGDAGDQSS